MWQKDWKRAVAYATECPIESIELDEERAKALALGYHLRDVGDSRLYDLICRPCDDDDGFIEDLNDKPSGYRLPGDVLGMLTRALVGMGAVEQLLIGREGRGLYGTAGLAPEEHEDTLIRAACEDEFFVTFYHQNQRINRHPFGVDSGEDRLLWCVKPFPVSAWSRMTFFHNITAALARLYRAGAAPQITGVSWWDMGTDDEYPGAGPRPHRALEVRMAWDREGPGTRFFTDWYDPGDAQMNPHRVTSARARTMADEWVLPLPIREAKMTFDIDSVALQTVPKGVC